MSDTITCTCENKFKVFETARQHRLMSCIRCRKRWWIGCSGRRLYGVKVIKLFVDDSRPEPKGWHRARTVTEAIRILATVPVEEISLDHDIACYDPLNMNEHPSPETFFAVAHYLAAMPKEIRPKIRIHTSNVAMGQQMANLLGLPYDNYIYNQKDYE